MTGRDVAPRRSGPSLSLRPGVCALREGRVVGAGTLTRVVPPPVVSLGGLGSLGGAGDASSSDGVASSASADEPRRDDDEDDDARGSSFAEYFLVRIATTLIALPSGATPVPSMDSPVTVALSCVKPGRPIVSLLNAKPRRASVSERLVRSTSVGLVVGREDAVRTGSPEPGGLSDSFVVAVVDAGFSGDSLPEGFSK